MRKKIEVKAKHIQKGKQGDCGSCMMSLAINEVLKDGYTCRTYLSDFAIFDKSQSMPVFSPVRGAQLPKTVTKAIESFDENKKSVKPFSTCINIPQELLK